MLSFPEPAIMYSNCLGLAQVQKQFCTHKQLVYIKIHLVRLIKIKCVSLCVCVCSVLSKT